MKVNRSKCRKGSNNKVNPNKNVCGLAVCRFYKVDKAVRYIHTVEDITRAFRTRYSVRSRKSFFKSGATVSSVKKNAYDCTKDAVRDGLVPYGYIIIVDGHVLSLDFKGEVTVDTDPRKSDRRKVKRIYLVTKK